MKKTMHIWPKELIEENGKIIASASIESANEKSFTLWFKLPVENRDDITKMCDPFVIATIFYGMTNSEKMIVHGQVSPSLLKNLEEFQAVWINWLPKKYKKVAIEADNECESDRYKLNKAIMAFSGGLDSCFTAYRHKAGDCGRQRLNIEAGIMVHGFDIQLKDEQIFRNAAEKSRHILNSIGMNLIPISTNFRDLGGDWDIVHEAGVAAALALFSRQYKTGIIASSFSYDSFNLNIPWGSNPLTDSLLSSESFGIINDGSMYNRTDKLELLINWREAMEHMRVCWQGEILDSNCCKCEKCVRNILSFYAIGLKPSKCFGQDITQEQIENVYVPDLAILFEYKCMLWAAEKRGIDAAWVRSLEKCIKRNEQRLNGKGMAFKKVRNKIAVRTRLRKLYNNLNQKNLKIYEGI